MSGALRATYRLQLGPGLGFREVAALVPSLRALGVSHLYRSPSLQARAGSTHGYDQTDPTRLSGELGGEDAFRELAGAGLPIVLDIVPNHMGTGEENRWWPNPEVFDINPDTGFYRRFFDIDDLGAVRMERPEVFELLHGKVLELVREGLVDGVRVDHPDGLADPAGYLRRLREAGVGHVWIEKNLHPGEPLRDWPVDGTVGYEFLVDSTALFVDPAAEEAFTALYAELTAERRPFGELAYEAQLEQAATTFAREVDWLRSLADLPGIAEALAALPVYRTYVEPWSGRVEEADRQAIAAAGMPEELARVLLLEDRGHDEFVTRFQQTSPPVTAKGVEDTAFYRYGRLLALNEVGGDPGRFGISVADFHAAGAERAERFPRNLLVSSTHDTKRSGDVRARLAALSWMPERWAERLRAWFALTEELVERGAPDAAERVMLLQNLLGAWPIDQERLRGFVEKALREAKVHTTWAEPDEDWEGRVQRFAARLLEHGPFLEDFVPFAEELAREGERVALGMTLLKLCAPGTTDVYGGDELWFLGLVDPDNRRPVDWEARREALAALRGGAQPTRATVKLYLLWRGLDLRARREEVFAGAYAPLDAGDGVCAFLRGEGEVLAVVPVRPGSAAGDAAVAGVPVGRWRDVLTGEEHALDGAPVAVAGLVERFGVGLLERVG